VGPREEQSGLEPRVVDASLAQPFGGDADRLLDCEAQAAWLTARFACARSSRRFSALASTDSRPAGVLSR